MDIRVLDFVHLSIDFSKKEFDAFLRGMQKVVEQKNKPDIMAALGVTEEEYDVMYTVCLESYTKWTKNS